MIIRINTNPLNTILFQIHTTTSVEMAGKEEENGSKYFSSKLRDVLQFNSDFSFYVITHSVAKYQFKFRPSI